MSAPLYNRFCRYSDREAKRFPRHTALRQMIPTWKRPSTTVFTLSDRAAYEAGWWSTEAPGELLRGMSVQYMPTERVWIEWNWKEMQNGSARMPIDSPVIIGSTREGLEWVEDRAPLRVGAMIRQSAYADEQRKKDGWFDLTCPPGSFMAMLCYLYPNGTFFLGPTFSFWHPTETMGHLTKSIVDMNVEKAANLHIAALGDHYLKRWGEQHPRLSDRLTERMAMILIGKDATEATSFAEVQGTTRLIMSALMAAISAKPTKYVEDPDRPSKDRKNRGGPKRPIVAVDLFMRERKRPGASLRASVGAQEAIKKGLHTVGAHYAYRSRQDGSDPRVCPIHPNGTHDFEEIPDTKSECCVLCEQKRWFRDSHERGDEAYGIVPRRVKHVRLGETT